MSVSTPPAVDHPATRRALRSLWLRASVLTCLSTAAAVVIVAWLTPDGSRLLQWPRHGWDTTMFLMAAAVAALPLTAFAFLAGIGRLVQTARMSRVLHRYPWRRLAGCYHTG